MLNKLKMLLMLLSKLLEDSWLLCNECVLNNKVAKHQIRNDTCDSTGCRGIAVEPQVFNATKLTQRCGASTGQGTRRLPDKLLLTLSFSDFIVQLYAGDSGPQPESLHLRDIWLLPGSGYPFQILDSFVPKRNRT
jgi:hypothetical protein